MQMEKTEKLTGKTYVQRHKSSKKKQKKTINRYKSVISERIFKGFVLSER